MFKTVFAALLSLMLVAVAEAQQGTVRVFDDEGNPVNEFEGMWHTADNGYSLWYRQDKGEWQDSFGSGKVVDVLIRANGFATALRRFRGEKLNLLRTSETRVYLKRGKEVTIEAQNPASPIPKTFVMESFFPEYSKRVHMMWNASNVRDQKPDWNMLNVRRVDETHFAVRVAEDTGPFLLAFQHPGWLQFCEFGPFQATDAATKGIQLPMPAPAKITVTFDPRTTEKEHAYQSVNCSIFWNPDDSGSIYGVTKSEVQLADNTPFTVADLGPGRYRVYVRTTPKANLQQAPSAELAPGTFADHEMVTLRSGESKEIAFAWAPFDPQAHRGSANAELKVSNRDGTIPTGRKIRVAWSGGHYGAHVLFNGPLADDGLIRLSGVSTVQHRGGSRFGPYSISIDGATMGFFRLQDTDQVQRLQFSPSPSAGDLAPDVELIDLASAQRRKLSDYRGQVVLLELWSTNSGLHERAIQELTDLSARMPPAWVNKVTLIGLNTDREHKRLISHIKERGWDNMPHFRASRGEGEYFSDPEKVYSAYRTPFAVLIDRSGTVRWSDILFSAPPDRSLLERIDELLK